jgi:hypothetical protein
MTEAGTSTAAAGRRGGRVVAPAGAVALVALAVAGIVAGAWPIEGVAVVVIVAAAVVLGARLIGGSDGLAAELGLAAATTAFVLAAIQAVQGAVSITTPAREVDGLEAGLGIGLALAAAVAVAGVAGRRVLGRLFADAWRGVSGAVRIVIAASLLEIAAWLSLVAFSGAFGIGFTPPAQVRYDPLPAYGLAGAILAVLVVRWTAPRLDVRLPVPAAWVAIVPAAGAVWAAITVFDQFRIVAAAFPGRFNELDTISLNLHLVAVALIAVGVLAEAVLEARRRMQGADRVSA